MDQDDRIAIRRAETPEDYRACQDVQRVAWGIVDEGYLVPVATMVGAQLHGGLVAGAFLPGGEAVGMTFGFLGRVEGRPCLYSQLTGVVPGYRDRGIGRRLKDFQRGFARREGLPCVAWAFDPFRPGNARFNLVHLGASSRRYVEDMYGPRTDALNVGVPTDRLIAEWDVEPGAGGSIGSEAITGLPRLIDAEPGREGTRRVRGVRLNLEQPLALLEIPGAIDRLRATCPEAADEWRAAVRQCFHASFSAGYRAVGFAIEGEDEDRRYYYLLG